MISPRHAAFLLPVAVILSVVALTSCDSDTSPPKETKPTPIDGAVVMTDAWAGTWDVVLTITDCATGDVVVIEDVVDTVCEGDTLSLGISDVLDYCDGTMDANAISASCSYEFDDGLCAVVVDMDVSLALDGETITGSGQWSVAPAPECPARYASGCEDVEISATRLDAGPTECDGTPGVANFGLRPLQHLGAKGVAK